MQNRPTAKLTKYIEKRNFEKTPEPVSDISKTKKEKKLIFVVQRHSATRLHFDFRLEDNGVLKSWAVPKGIPVIGEKHLAVETEDHPISYANFHGVIPKGNYGAGTVDIYDKGVFVNITVKNGKVQPLSEAIEKGHFLIFVKGKKMNGGYALTKIKDKNWIFVKMNDNESKNYKDNLTLLINKKEVNLTNLNKFIDEGIKKGDLVEYYKKIAPLMLPHIKGRPISMQRFPEGVKGKSFFQKNVPDYFPSWIDRLKIDDTTYPIANDDASIVYLSNQVSVPHLFLSQKEKIDSPDKMIFDLDPSKDEIRTLKKAALLLRKFLTDLGFTPFIMTTGGKGYHIVVPIVPDSTFDEVRFFAGKIANVFASSNPDVLTTELNLKKRKERIFVDVNRNSPKQTAVAPYAVRFSLGLPVATPFDWKDLDKIDPKTFNIFSDFKSDPWKDFFKHKVSIKKVMAKLKS